MNTYLIKRKWIASSHANKEFTHVTVSQYGDIWDKKRSFAPSALDRVLSFLLIFAPMFLIIPTVDFLYNELASTAK